MSQKDRVKFDTTKQVLTTKLDVFKERLERINERLRGAKAPEIVATYKPRGIRLIHNNQTNVSVRGHVTEVSLSRRLESENSFIRILAKSRVDLKTGSMTHSYYGELTPEEVIAVDKPEDNCRCDHCQTTRKRVFMYTLENENGRFRVGSGCVDAFAGQSIAVWIKSQEDAAELLDKYADITFADVRDHSVVEVDAFLAEIVTIISEQKGGFEHSSDYAMQAFANIQGKYESDEDAVLSYPEDVVAQVEAIKSMITQTEYQEDQRYRELNVNRRNIVNCGYLSLAQSPILASGALWYFRQAEFNAEKARREAEAQQKSLDNAHIGLAHIGTPGEKLILKDLFVKRIISNPDGFYGPTTSITMVSPEGLVINWKASGIIGEDVVKEGQSVNVQGKVKANKGHAVFYSKLFGKEIKATEIGHCKFLTHEEVKELEDQAKNPKPKRTRKREDSLNPAA